MKTVFGSSGTRARVDSIMTPMIDVVFLLLIFFLTTSSFERLEKQLPSALATSPDAPPAGHESSPLPPTEISDFHDIVIKLAMRDGSVKYRLQDQDLDSFEELEARTATIIKIRSDIPVIIDPDRNIQAGEAIKVYDLIRRQGSLSVFLVAK